MSDNDRNHVARSHAPRIPTRIDIQKYLPSYLRDVQITPMTSRVIAIMLPFEIYGPNHKVPVQA